MSKINKKFSIFRFVLIILLLPIVIIWLIIRKIKDKRAINSDNIDIFNISQIDSLSGEEFEELLKEIFIKQGYEVELTKKSHDYGADLVLKKNGRLSIVQAKCYGKNIGIKAIQEVISARVHYGAEEMFVATNRYFSKDAIVLASEHGVILIDRDVVTRLVREYSPKLELKEKRFVATVDEEKRKIMQKYKFWI